MDHRTPLQRHTVLAFEGLSCHIEEMIGSGSNAIVYKGWYPDHLDREVRHHVLVKELFPFHPDQKIFRGETGTVVVEPEAQDLWQSHRRSFERGNRTHLKLLYDHPDLMALGANLNSFSYNDTLYSVLGYTGGRSLQEALNRESSSLRHTALRMIALLDALEAFHKSGCLHLDISPDNIMLVGQDAWERIFLIDYNSTREVGSLEKASLSRKKGYFAPETSIGKREALGYATDLYSVAAVFFRCLMGRTLTLTEQVQKRPPAAKESPLLEDMPQTVQAMVAAILQKGLEARAKFRYQSIGQMRRAFQELLDRIDCVGVTHWSLWENGKQSVEELIRNNPSLGYLQQEKALYPIRLECRGSMTLEAYLEHLLSPEGTSGLILAQGGMGKTTLLLHTAMLRGRQYSPNAPAVFYISLNGWEKGDPQYIRRQILQRLRFKPEENTYETALHALHKVLEQPLNTAVGQQIPSVLLLLDGLNEVSGDMEPLIREIRELKELPGVRLLGASRRQIPELELETAELMRLDGEDVARALGREGLLIPQQPQILQLLRTPLILSIYIQASEGGKQLYVRSEEELMAAYMQAMLNKELCRLPEDSPQRWQMDAALNYLLPAIAARQKKTGKSLTKPQLLKLVKKCRWVLRSSQGQKAFPQWIGHKRDIFHNAVRPDDWFDVMVHQLLWKQLGMLVKDDNGRYRVFHQQVGDYLAGVYRRLAPRTRRSANPAAVLVLIWGILLALIISGNYTDRLLRNIDVIVGEYSHAELYTALQVHEVHAAVRDYLAEPTAGNYQLARSATSRALKTVEEQYRDVTPMSEINLSKMDGRRLAQAERNPEYLMYYADGYISDNPVFDWLMDSVEDDFTMMLCTMDVLLENHRQQKIPKEDVEAAMDLIYRIYLQRSELMSMIGCWFDYPFTRYEGEPVMEPESFEEAAEKLRDLSDAFCIAVGGYSPQVRNQIQDRLQLVRFPGMPMQSLEEILCTVPSQWVKPAWLPENADYDCVMVHPYTSEVVTYRYDPEEPEDVAEPLAWSTVCYSVSREELMAYLEDLQTMEIPVTLRQQETYVEAVVHFPAGDLTVRWVPMQTTLTLTGFVGES